MYKIGVMVMGKPSASPKKVKQIILEVEAKTKVNDILSYMLQLNKITDLNVNIAIQKGGRPVSQASTVAQILRHTKPVNNVIKLFLYENEQRQDELNKSSQKIVFQKTKHQQHIQMLQQKSNNKKVQKQTQGKNQIKQAKNNKQNKSQQDELIKKSGGCCCC